MLQERRNDDEAKSGGWVKWGKRGRECTFNREWRSGEREAKIESQGAVDTATRTLCNGGREAARRALQRRCQWWAWELGA